VLRNFVITVIGGSEVFLVLGYPTSSFIFICMILLFNRPSTGSLNTSYLFIGFCGLYLKLLLGLLKLIIFIGA